MMIKMMYFTIWNHNDVMMGWKSNAVFGQASHINKIKMKIVRFLNIN